MPSEKKDTQSPMFDRYGRTFHVRPFAHKAQAHETVISHDPNEAHDDVHRETDSKHRCDGHGDLHGVHLARQVDTTKISANKVKLFGCVTAEPSSSKQENQVVSLISKL